MKICFFEASSNRCSNLDDVALQHLWVDMNPRPEDLEKLVVASQSSGMLNEIAHDVKRFGREQNPFLDVLMRTMPEALVDGVEAERRKLLHRSGCHRCRPSAVMNGRAKQRVRGVPMAGRSAYGGFDRTARIFRTR